MTFLSLEDLEWRLDGWMPNLWNWKRSMETHAPQGAEFPNLPAKVPGSVQQALRNAGLLPDFYLGFHVRQCEWVENRHWCFRCEVPLTMAEGHRYELVLPGVDTTGQVFWDGQLLGHVNCAHRPHAFPLPADTAARHHLMIVLTCPERFLGQIGRTPEMSITKPRFYYTWDWTPRLVQLGITRAPFIRDLSVPQLELKELWCDGASLHLKGILLNQTDGLTATLSRHGDTVAAFSLTAAEFAAGWTSPALSVERWQPNLNGEPVLYDLTLTAAGAPPIHRRVGFKSVRWLPCADAPKDADPWLCEVNGVPTYLQGFNWVPIRPLFADVRREDVERRLRLYRDMGCNILRVWGGASREADCFYDLCDEYGIMVWQEFPMSSSGIANDPPNGPEAIAEMGRIADHYLQELPPHVCLLAWSGGNELQRAMDGSEGCGKPCTLGEPMLAMLAETVRRHDPTRRFMVTSASGPRFCADAAEYGKGLHWDVHGPWKADGNLTDWADYWAKDDALFRSEYGAPSAQDATLIEKYAHGEAVFPANAQTPLWRFPLDWWIEQPVFEQEKGRPPKDLAEYTAWSQQRQARALEIATVAIKSRFPKCGGGIIWMGHASFPCPADSSVIDFEGTPKPAVAILSRLFHTPPSEVKTIH